MIGDDLQDKEKSEGRQDLDKMKGPVTGREDRDT